jgi:hypothetical protein
MSADADFGPIINQPTPRPVILPRFSCAKA